MPTNHTQSAINNPATPGHRYRLPNLQHKLGTVSPQPELDARENVILPVSKFRLFVKFTLIVSLAAICIYAVATYVGAELARAGHTISTTERKIIINSDIVTAPANIIRYPSQRKIIEAKRLDLYLVWPSLEGYSEKLKAEFSDVENSGNIIFVSLIPRFSQYDMSQRIEPIYKKFFIGPQVDLKNGLVGRTLDPRAGFLDEFLMIQTNSSKPFAARCIHSPQSATTPYCIRDINIGQDLSLTYRFHRKLSPHWRELDEAIGNKFATMIN